MQENNILPVSSGKVISFNVGEQEYCVDILRVREIRGWTEATPLPGTPRCIKGVINLRGIIVPVIDMCELLHVSHHDSSDRNVVMVIDVDGKTAGLLVSKVSDILDITAEMVQDVPVSSTDEIDPLVSGLIAFDGRMIGFLQLSVVAEQALESTP
ncbi:chemotaxis protein CheW [Acetobacter sp.]|jgi:purine-binding chemotaxis protein CheW|uniref:chemotaxis protein CheW n=1 Tax=Acetobacter sp. TaxID=440 RepID=UPI0025C2FDEE|nr:chemotaxis protein CheW [Acetobacter sp.]MCH4091024.1 chemotaxis protein CheW [Acetobacter sp.]MCI1300207.1 chemotaxis protein CheW [Acetobacter sp.]MCI1316125.1 chemotaxis protein CheW [Acetobacter sp.]